MMRPIQHKLWNTLLRFGFLLTMVFFSNFFVGYGQQKISISYDKPMLKEDFNEENKNWNYQTTYENFFVVDKGDLFLNRINPTNPYAFLSNWENPLTTFQIRSALKLSPDQGKDQTIGLIFLVQKDGSGAVVMEFNRNKEYRIKQLINGKFYKYLSGEKESQGWVKSGFLTSKDEYNELDVQVNEGQMDFYINKKFVNSFNVESFKSGGLGFIIGANTKAKIDFFNVYGTSTADDTLQNLNGTYVNKLHGEELIAKQGKDIDSLKREIRAANQRYVNYQKERDQEFLRMKNSLDTYIRQNDSLEVKVRKLNFLEDEMLLGIDSDVLLTLTTELREQIKRNQALEAEVEGYKDSIYYINKKFQELKVKLLNSVIDKRSAEIKSQEQALKEIKKELQKQSAKEPYNPANFSKEESGTANSSPEIQTAIDSENSSNTGAPEKSDLNNSSKTDKRTKIKELTLNSEAAGSKTTIGDTSLNKIKPIPSKVRKAVKGNRP